MYASFKNLLSSLAENGVIEEVRAQKPEVKATISCLQKERNQLIDQMCASWGNDRTIRQRYFQLA